MIQCEVVGIGKVESRKKETAPVFTLPPLLKRPVSWGKFFVVAGVATTVFGLSSLPARYVQNIPDRYTAVAQALTERKAFLLNDMRRLNGDPASAAKAEQRKLTAIAIGNDVVATLPDVNTARRTGNIDQQFWEIQTKVIKRMQAKPDLDEPIEIQEANGIRVAVEYKPRLVKHGWPALKQSLLGYIDDVLHGKIFPERSLPSEQPALRNNAATGYGAVILVDTMDPR